MTRDARPAPENGGSPRRDVSPGPGAAGDVDGPGPAGVGDAAVGSSAVSSPGVSSSVVDSSAPGSSAPGSSAPGSSAGADDIAVRTAQQTRELGVRLASGLRAGDLVLLTGELGAGKTTLTQGIAEGLRVRGPITSPTFVIARVHPSLVGGPVLVHADAYRLQGSLDLEALDLDADLDRAVTVVEWGRGLAEDLTDDYLEVELFRAIGESGRAADDAGGGGTGDTDDADHDADDTDDDTDDVRIARITGHGARWA